MTQRVLPAKNQLSPHFRLRREYKQLDIFGARDSSVPTIRKSQYQ